MEAESPSTSNLSSGVSPTEGMPMAMHSRKQNVACDACRARKVKCLSFPGQAKCQHCVSKNFECTHFQQQLTSEKRRVVGMRRTKVTPPESRNGRTHQEIPPSEVYGTYRSQTTPTLQLIDWLFSPPEDSMPVPSFVGGPVSAGYRQFAIRSKSSRPFHIDAEWGDLRKHLEPEDFRIELAADLVEVYFQICHSRMPLLSPAEFRSRLKAFLRPSSSADSTLTPLPPALLATVIAWGAKFSEHPLLVHDRDTNSGRSRLCRILTRRAREIAEGEKIHRIPTLDNVVIALLLEPLQSQDPQDPDGFRGFWLNCGIRHLFELQVNRKAVLATIPDDARGTMMYAWWMACLADAYAAVYWRRKPVIEEHDYDIEFVSDMFIFPADAMTTADVTRTWMASLSMAKIARALARQLARPDVVANGIHYSTLRETMSDLHRWKDEYLQSVGVPNNFQANWDFIAAVSACTCDAQYHVMWVILHSALDEFSLREAKDGTMNIHDYESLERQVSDEALNGALRIAGLTSVLTSNGYLRLDPNILHFSTYAAGMFLARSGRPEVKTCIKGLEQYSYAYEEAYQQAQWMQRVYAEVIDPSNRNPQLQSHHSHRPAQTHPLHHSSLSSSSSSMNSTGAAGMDPASAISIYMSMNSEGGSNPSLHESPYPQSPSTPMLDQKGGYSSLGYVR